MATKKTVKKAAKPAPKKATAKPAAKKTAKPAIKKTAKPAAKKPTKPASKPVKSDSKAKPVVKKVATAKKAVASKPVAKAKPLAKKTVKPAAKKAIPTKPAAKPAAKKATPAKPLKKVEKPAKVAKPVKVKVEKPAKAPKPPKAEKSPKKPVAPVLSAKEIAAQKKAVKEALLKELDKVVPPPPPPKEFQRRVEQKSNKPIKIPKVSTTESVPYKPDFIRSVMDTPKQQDTSPLVRYSDNELNEFKEIITKKLDAARRELSYLQGLITRKDEMGGDTGDTHYMTMEDGSMSMEREQISQMASRQITYIDHLEKALMRIENKTYGICRETGKLIDKARLRAVPHATLSIEAKMMRK
jgi:RNA polymerase-binding transcription factor DksA